MMPAVATHRDDRLATLVLRSRAIARGWMQGIHASPLVGHSVEFSSHRRYVRGDDPRHVNWKLFARHGKLFVKQYDAETDLRVHVVIDASGSMACREGGTMTKFEYAASIGLAIAIVAIDQRDAVSFSIVGDDGVHDHLRPSSRGGHVEAIAASIESAWPIENAKRDPTKRSDLGIGEAIGRAGELTRGYGVAFLLSDFVDDVERIADGLRSWRYRNHDTSMFHILDPWERHLPEPGRFRVTDLESANEVTTELESIRVAYLKRVNDWIGGVRKAALSQSISHEMMTTDRDPTDALIAAVSKR